MINKIIVFLILNIIGSAICEGDKSIKEGSGETPGLSTRARVDVKHFLESRKAGGVAQENVNLTGIGLPRSAFSSIVKVEKSAGDTGEMQPRRIFIVRPPKNGNLRNFGDKDRVRGGRLSRLDKNILFGTSDTETGLGRPGRFIIRRPTGNSDLSSLGNLVSNAPLNGGKPGRIIIGRPSGNVDLSNLQNLGDEARLNGGQPERIIIGGSTENDDLSSLKSLVNGNSLNKGFRRRIILGGSAGNGGLSSLEKELDDEDNRAIELSSLGNKVSFGGSSGETSLGRPERIIIKRPAGNVGLSNMGSLTELDGLSDTGFTNLGNKVSLAESGGETGLRRPRCIIIGGSGSGTGLRRPGRIIIGGSSENDDLSMPSNLGDGNHLNLGESDGGTGLGRSEQTIVGGSSKNGDLSVLSNLGNGNSLNRDRFLRLGNKVNFGPFNGGTRPGKTGRIIGAPSRNVRLSSLGNLGDEKSPSGGGFSSQGNKIVFLPSNSQIGLGRPRRIVNEAFDGNGDLSSLGNLRVNDQLNRGPGRIIIGGSAGSGNLINFGNLADEGRLNRGIFSRLGNLFRIGKYNGITRIGNIATGGSSRPGNLLNVANLGGNGRLTGSQFSRLGNKVHLSRPEGGTVLGRPGIIVLGGSAGRGNLLSLGNLRGTNRFNGGRFSLLGNKVNFGDSVGGTGVGCPSRFFTGMPPRGEPIRFNNGRINAVSTGRRNFPQSSILNSQLQPTEDDLF